MVIRRLATSSLIIIGLVAVIYGLVLFATCFE